MKRLHLLSGLALLLATRTAFSHIVLHEPTALAGSNYRAVLRVGHGCDGLATTGISVRIPPGVQGAKPMPKPGWLLEVRTELLATPYTSHGKRVEAEVSEISWTAQGKEAALPDNFYDEFVLRATLPPTPSVLWFKVIQTCNDAGQMGRKDWTQVPAEGSSTRGLSQPAARLTVEAAHPALPATAPPAAAPMTPAPHVH
jgi:uncharacterized protein YcnI